MAYEVFISYSHFTPLGREYLQQADEHGTLLIRFMTFIIVGARS